MAVFHINNPKIGRVQEDGTITDVRDMPTTGVLTYTSPPKVSKTASIPTASGRITLKLIPMYWSYHPQIMKNIARRIKESKN